MVMGIASLGPNSASLQHNGGMVGHPRQLGRGGQTRSGRGRPNRIKTWVCSKEPPMAIKYVRPLESRLRPVEAAAFRQLDLTTRMRRNRRSEWARRMVCETVLTSADLIWPL